MRNFLEHFRHFDVYTFVVTLLILPLATYFIGIIRKHGKAWGGFLVEGVCYWVGRFVMHSLEAVINFDTPENN